MKKHIAPPLVLIILLTLLTLSGSSIADSNGTGDVPIYPLPSPDMDIPPIGVFILTQQNLFQLRMLDTAQRLDTYGQYLFNDNEALGQAYVDAGIEAQRLANLQLDGIETQLQLEAYIRIQHTIAHNRVAGVPNRQNILIEAAWASTIARIEGNVADLNEDNDDDSDAYAPSPENPFPENVQTLIQQANQHPYLPNENHEDVITRINNAPSNSTFF